MKGTGSPLTTVVPVETLKIVVPLMVVAGVEVTWTIGLVPTWATERTDGQNWLTPMIPPKKVFVHLWSTTRTWSEWELPLEST